MAPWRETQWELGIADQSLQRGTAFIKEIRSGAPFVAIMASKKGKKSSPPYDFLATFQIQHSTNPESFTYVNCIFTPIVRSYIPIEISLLFNSFVRYAPYG